MSDAIENKIKAWLKTQGYPLEMRVASAFQARGFSITQSDYYKDLEGDKYREIDIVASMGTFADQDRQISFDIRFVIEWTIAGQDRDIRGQIFNVDNHVDGKKGLLGSDLKMETCGGKLGGQIFADDN